MGSGDFPASFLQDHVRSGGRNVRPGWPIDHTVVLIEEFSIYQD